MDYMHPFICYDNTNCKFQGVNGILTPCRLVRTSWAHLALVKFLEALAYYNIITQVIIDHVRNEQKPISEPNIV